MIRVSELRLNPGEDCGVLKASAARKAGVKPEEVLSWRVVRKSVDARKKDDVHFSVSVELQLADEARARKRADKCCSFVSGQNARLRRIPLDSPPRIPPVVVGLGPGGLFAAWILAQCGANPVVLERGQDVARRRRTIDRFFAGGELDPESNIQFGEGGAGAFSDGKLTTGIKDVRCREVLETLHRFGAPEDILYLAHPHIGTDRLPAVVGAMRAEIERLGGRVLFGAKLTGITVGSGALRAIRYADAQGSHELPCERLLPAIGHSAADTQEMFFRAGMRMTPKPFSVGFRIEHPQSLINRAQYGKFADHPALPPAEYRLSAHLKDGRGVYTFCMCPGGRVVGAASRIGGVCVNGMSPYARDGENANAAVLVDVRPDDFGDDDPLAGFVFQRMLEERAFRAGGSGYRAPCQRAEDFLAGRESRTLGGLVRPTCLPGVREADLNAILPPFAAEDLGQALRVFDARLPGFAHPDALLTGLETRSSCPVRWMRGEEGEASIRGIFPCGEGAGLAGGIMSAAVDGIREAEMLLRSLQDDYQVRDGGETRPVSAPPAEE